MTDEKTYVVTEAELKGLAGELTDSLSLLLAISTDMVESGHLEMARLISAFLLHKDDDTDAISGLYTRLPELREFVLERAKELAEGPEGDGAAGQDAAGQCADYPNCSCGDIERSLEVMEGPLL